jgi:hypothetical protein
VREGRGRQDDEMAVGRDSARRASAAKGEEASQPVEGAVRTRPSGLSALKLIRPRTEVHGAECC